MVFVLVEGLPRRVIEKDMDDLFNKHGRVVSMSLKIPSRAGAIALVEYASTQDGEIACRELQGFHYNANRLRAELWHGDVDMGPRSQYATQHRIQISYLPPTATMREVKDLLSAVADVLAVEVDRRGSAWASFATHYDMKRVIDKLDDTEFRGERLRIKRDETPIFTPNPNASTASESTARNGPSHSSGHATPTASARSPSSSRSRYERTTSSTRSRSRSPPRSRRRSSSRSPTRHRSSSDRRSRSRSHSRSASTHSSSRRYMSRSRSRSR